MTAPDRRERSGAAREIGVLPILLMAPFLAQADATIVNVATPAIRTDLGLYLALASRGDTDSSDSFALTTIVLAATAAVAAGAAYLSVSSAHGDIPSGRNGARDSGRAASKLPLSPGSAPPSRGAAAAYAVPKRDSGGQSGRSPPR